MSTVLDRLEELRAGVALDADCPRCNVVTRWWMISVPRDEDGLACPACDFVLDLLAPPPAPPIIMCSQCGGDLALAGAGYWCEPCDRTVP